ncbi:MAG TPA: AMP-binding protein [Bdellovibrionales bacterium]|nr:AMP-binding protein [Bdellovibrionales bacterium]
MTPFWVSKYPVGVPATVDDTIAQYSSVLDVFEEACGRFPARPAFTQMDRTFTFSELNRKAECFAAFLQNELKLKKGERIALQMPNVLQYPVAMFGAIKAGLIVVNTNPLYTDREMKHQFNDAGVSAVVILANFACNLQKILTETKIRHVIVTEIGDMLSFPKNLLVNAVVKHVKKMVPDYSIPDAIQFSDAMKRGAAMTYTRVPMQADDVAFLQYTGGTTGVSKGAMLTHKNVIGNMEQIRVWIAPLLKEGQEIGICALPLYHIFALTLHGLALMKYGAHGILITNPKDMPAFVKELKKYKFTVMSGVNTLFNALANNPGFQQLNFSTLKVSVAGGMALQKAVAQKWTDVTKTKVIEGYGLTEASPVICCNPVDGTDRVGTIGLPLPSTFVRMIKDDGTEAAIGEPGELCAKGPQVMKGYWQRPDDTAQVLDKDGYLKTGDIGVMEADGFCRIVDRKKEMILVSGFNVYPNEVEDVIAHHPGVLEVGVIGVPDEKSGEVVKAVIVKKDPALTAEDVIAFCKKNLTSYKVPKHVEFRKELPKSNIGKILRRMLKDN